MNVKEITNTILKTQILEAFKSSPEAIEAMVASALSLEVDRHTGRKDGYSGDRVSYLDYIVGDTLRAALRDAVVQEIAARRDDIREEVKKRLSSTDMVDALTKTIVQATAEEWRINVTFGKDERR